MEICTTINSLNSFLSEIHKSGKRVGFVPTMGALHMGHVSLVERAILENDMVVSSIFVNPAQFNNKTDLTNYPRTPDNDHKLLSDAGCDLVFEPGEDEMYPADWIPVLTDTDFGQLETVMEGKFRPGHFAGVAKVVSRLFSIVKPDIAYFGEKDFQQLAIIREMNKRMGGKIRITGCPTVRTASGLAMSSRNIHLTAEELIASPVIYETLQMATDLIIRFGVEKAKSQMIEHIEKRAGLKVEYLEFVDSATLQPIENYMSGKDQRACIAVITQKTRLIDNIAL